MKTKNFSAGKINLATKHTEIRYEQTTSDLILQINSTKNDKYIVFAWYRIIYLIAAFIYKKIMLFVDRHSISFDINTDDFVTWIILRILRIIVLIIMLCFYIF
jgi:hypothetical protein